jgi:hypothetical protein
VISDGGLSEDLLGRGKVEAQGSDFAENACVIAEKLMKSTSVQTIAITAVFGTTSLTRLARELMIHVMDFVNCAAYLALTF